MLKTAKTGRAMAARATLVTLRRLRCPLTTPYKLAFGPVEAFDTILVEITDRHGKSGFGEATFLPGYSEETVEAAWERARALARRAAGLRPAEIVAAAQRLLPEGPFTATAFASACEMLSGHPLLNRRTRTAVPLLAIVNAMEPAAWEAEIEAQLAAGYRTLKVKVGFDVAADLARVERIRQFVAGRAAIRVDGNQGYGREDALDFAAALEPDGIMLLEQPAAADDWDTAAALARVSTVPMMLDESIFGPDDILRAAELDAARYIKLKLMKAGGIDRLVDALARIRALGMIPVLGNGVAGDVGCWMEACVAVRMIDNAGEMNGFLKPRAGLFRSPIEVRDGAMILEPGGMPPLDPDALDAATVQREVIRAK